MAFLTFAWAHLPNLLIGAAIALALWMLAMLFGFVLALAITWCRIYGNRVLYALSTAYVEVFRGTPMLVQMFVVYLGLPDIGIVLSSFTAAAVAIALNSAAYQAEYFRGSIQSIPAGQMTAARAIGMSRFAAVRSIILPQALRRVIPQWSNEAILELKFTSIAFAIGVSELTARAEQIGYSTFRFFDIFIVAAIIYLVMTGTVAQVLDVVERRTRVPGLGGEAAERPGA